MAKVEFVHNPGGYFEVMKSGDMRELLKEQASSIKGSAESTISEDKGTPLDLEPYSMHEFTTSERAGVRVQTSNPHAFYAEAKHGILQNAAGV